MCAGAATPMGARGKDALASTLGRAGQELLHACQAITPWGCARLWSCDGPMHEVSPSRPLPHGMNNKRGSVMSLQPARPMKCMYYMEYHMHIHCLAGCMPTAWPCKPLRLAPNSAHESCHFVADVVQTRRLEVRGRRMVRQVCSSICVCMFVLRVVSVHVLFRCVAHAFLCWCYLYVSFVVC